MPERKVGERLIRLVEGDITDMELEAFVFDIEQDCKLGSGYGTAIANRAGKVVQDQLDEIGNCPTGTAVITEAGKMKAKHIIYANGPKYHEPDTEGKLRNATLASLKLADEKGIKQLAFPPMGTGMYQVPLDLCATVMLGTVEEYLKGDTNLEEVVFVALDTREHKPFEAKF